MDIKIQRIAAEKAQEFKSRKKRIKVRAIFKKFGYQRRTDKASHDITMALRRNGVTLFPPIQKIGDVYRTDFDDLVTVFNLPPNPTNKKPELTKLSKPTLSNEGSWISKLLKIKLRNESEVVSNFIIPILKNLGYKTNERYIEMPVEWQTGVKKRRGRVDVGCFAKNYNILEDQVILIVEAKGSNKTITKKEIAQTESYAKATYSHFGLITNGKEIKVLQFFNHIGKKPLEVFNSKIQDLEKNYSKLSDLIAKDKLVKHYYKLYDF